MTFHDRRNHVDNRTMAVHKVIPAWHGEGRAPTLTQSLALRLRLELQQVQVSPSLEDPSTAGIIDVLTTAGTD